MPAAMSQGDRPVLPEAVEAAGGDPGEVERRRADAADAGDPPMTARSSREVCS